MAPANEADHHGDRDEQKPLATARRSVSRDVAQHTGPAHSSARQ
jgi:hypothetical protein